MNKQELIEAVIKLPVDCSAPRPKIDKLTTLELIKLLDEPQKVVVPQFVAEWYEEHKDNFDYNLWEYLVDWDRQKPSDFKEWIAEGDKYEPLITLVNMHQFGYEVGEEKRYRISMPKARNHKNHAQILCEKDGSIFWCGEWYPFRTKFTRKQLEEANFGWVFDCEGIEIEEVE